jgi:hypothetical protein
MHPNSQKNQPRAQQRGMAQHRIIDERHGGLVVATFSHPSEWRAASRVVWNMQHTELPAKVSATASNANGVEAFEFLPMEAYFWLEIDYGTVPIGHNSHGLVRMPPRSAPNALANLVIPNYRGDRRNLRVTGVQPVQNLWQIFDDPPPQQGEGVMARVEYEERGHAIEEEFYGVYSWNQGGGQLNWGFGRLFCFRAARGELDGVRETFWRIAGSLQPTPQWQQLYEQVLRQLKGEFMGNIAAYYDRLRQEQIAVANNIAYNDRLINERNAKVNASIEQTQREIRERSQYHYTPQEAFGDVMMNRTAFEDPNSAAGNPHYEQGNPQYTYVNERGEFYSTNDPMDDPNIGSSWNWVPAQRLVPNR